MSKNQIQTFTEIVINLTLYIKIVICKDTDLLNKSLKLIFMATIIMQMGYIILNLQAFLFRIQY